MQTQYYDHYFVFDVESVGLYGPPFAFGFIVCNKDGVELENGGWWYNIFTHGQPVKNYRSHWSFTDEDVEWVENHVVDPTSTDGVNKLLQVETFSGLFRLVRNTWERCEQLYNNMAFAADCPFPVETNFIRSMLTLYNVADMKHSPYPLLDVGSMLIARGLDPLADYQRYEEEQPIHNPLADARQSARLLMSVLGHTLRGSQ